MSDLQRLIDRVCLVEESNSQLKATLRRHKTRIIKLEETTTSLRKELNAVRKQKAIVHIKEIDELKSEFPKVEVNFCQYAYDSVFTLIMSIVASKFPVKQGLPPLTIEQIKSSSRQKEFVTIRYVSIYIYKNFYNKYATQKYLGSLIGRRDHSTVIHGLRAVENWSLSKTFNKKLKECIEDVKKELNNVQSTTETRTEAQEEKETYSEGIKEA
jgi:ATPase involved in DNA replication initiation